MDFASRYKTSMSVLFTRQYKLELEHRVELALLQALGTVGLIPTQAYSAIKEAVDAGRVTLERTLAIEAETQHDIMAMVKALAETSAEYGGFVHYGATSQDINDTVLALQLNAAKHELLSACTAVRAQLTALASRHQHLVCIARTHGQHAIPITMGFKFSNFLYELSTAESFLQRVSIPAKFSGAVGTFASLKTREVERLICQQLQLTAAPISTQVVSRLFVADFVFACSAIAAALERLGKEIRNLQRTELAETAEGFGSGQVGSSTMPQKRNPHKSERVCGLAREVRSALGPAMETIGLEHERDLTNSSVERCSLPRAACLTHYILQEMEKVSDTAAAAAGRRSRTVCKTPVTSLRVRR